MTTKTELTKTFEKPWYKSKKFIAFLLMELLLFALALLAMLTQDEIGWPLAAYMFGIIVSMGAMALAFNGRQAQLDAYVRGMAMVGRVVQHAPLVGTVSNARTYPDVLPRNVIENDYRVSMPAIDDADEFATGGENGEI